MFYGAVMLIEINFTYFINTQCLRTNIFFGTKMQTFGNVSMNVISIPLGFLIYSTPAIVLKWLQILKIIHHCCLHYNL